MSDFDYLCSRSPDFVLKRLTNESRNVVLDEMAGILAAHQARELAARCAADLPDAEKEVVRFEKEFKEAQTAADRARVEHDKVKREEEKLRRQRGVGERELAAAGDATKRAARALIDAESWVRTLTHDLRLARQHVFNLSRLADGLGDYQPPAGDVLSLLAKALEVNGRD